MLYPKNYKKKEENKWYERLEYIKESIFVLIKSFRNHHSFILFLKQKLHF